jgi:DNA-binding LytR/AlgR family response regulator
MIQNNDSLMMEKIRSSINNTIPHWKNQMVLAMSLFHSDQAMKAQREVTNMTNQLLEANAKALHQGSVDAYSGESLYQIPLSDIYYIEAVDDRTYLYLENECYESRRRLYEFEEILPERSFVRISKSVIVNMMKIVAIKPAMNGRFLCRLKNDENVIISRKYVPEVREKLRG